MLRRVTAFATAFAILLLVSQIAVHAQSTPFLPGYHTWFWAWQDSRTEFTAYTADGLVNALPVEQSIRFVTEAVRVDDSTALVVAGDDTSASVFQLNDREARALYTTTVSVDPDGDPRLLPGISVWDALWDPRSPRLLLEAFGMTMLYDASTGDLMPLDLPDFRTARLIPDGIRYSLRNDAEAGIYDYSLETGETTSLYTLAPSEDDLTWFCAPRGSVWVCESAPADAPLMITRVLVRPDGNAEILPDGADVAEGFDGRAYLVTLSGVEEGRSLTIQPLDGESTVTVFSLPPEFAIPPTDPLQAISVIEPERVLIGHNSGFYVVSPNRSTAYLGNYFCCGPFDTIRRPWYGLFLEGDTVLWNVSTGAIVMRAPYSIVPGRSGFIEGAFLAGESEGEVIAYTFADDRAVLLPALDSGQLLAALPDGVFVYTDYAPWQEDPGDIFRLTPDEGFISLIDDAYPVMVRSAP